ncbi:hypothetical protein MG293_001315 [Ovis ammon polii]|uniref:Protein S100-A10 n=1 Tax=Ovis ammon polii TaxID=230172 RepID=A0AAD4UR43_OVIAM|nr:hypothetical protein MG293_001315 [Ovis ammon polii]
MDYQAPPSMGFSRQAYWSGLPFPSPGDLPDPGIEPGSPTLEADALNSEPPGKPMYLGPQNFRLQHYFPVSTDFTKMPSQMEHAMETMMFTFHKFAGDKGYLTKEDLRVLMEKEFPGFLENQKDPLAVDKIMKDLDQCRDGKVGFQSFFSLIAGLTIACNDYFVVHMKQKGKK